MHQIIVPTLQEDMHELVSKKLLFINPTTFDSDDDRTDFTGKDNVQWNLHHFIRVGKLCSNGFYSAKNTLTYIYSISDNIIKAIGECEKYDRLEQRLNLQHERLINNVAELNMALAEYEMIFEDIFARKDLDEYNNTTDERVKQLMGFAKDSAKKGEPTSAYFNYMASATKEIAIAQVAMQWFSNTLDAKINPDKSAGSSKSAPSILSKIKA